MDERKEVEKQEEITSKAITLQLSSDGHLEMDATDAFSVEEVIFCLKELEFYCCDNLNLHPVLLHHLVGGQMLAEIYRPEESEEESEAPQDPIN